MANRYLVAAGGNWTADTSWSTTDGGANDTIAPTASDDVFLTANSGQCTISATSVGKSLNCTGYTGTLTHNTAIGLTISGSVTFVAGMTYTPGAIASITINAAGTLTTGGLLMANISHTAAGTLTLGDNLSFLAQKTSFFQTSQAVDLAGFTISGNSSTNRLDVRSTTLGTASGTITLNGGTFANADFRDITLSAPADLSAITGLSGDRGGNTNITFTTAATQTYTGGTGSWSDITKWTSRVPLPQDNVLMSGVTGGTITADMPRLGKSIDWTGASGTPTWADSVANTLYGSLTLISGMTFTFNDGTTFEGRGSHTITSAGKSFIATEVFAAFGGTYDLQDAFNVTGSSITLSNGTLNTNGFAVTIGNIFNLSNSNTRAFNFTNSTLTTSGVSGTPWALATSTGMTLTTTGSTILLSDTGASSKTFAGGGLTYNNLSISGGGAGAVIITGANTFNSIDCVGPKTITFPSATTTTVSNWLVAGSDGAYIIINASSTTQATLSDASGTSASNYLSINSSNAVGGATWYAGALSADSGGNSGWLFESAPVVPSGGLSSLMYTQGWI